MLLKRTVSIDTVVLLRIDLGDDENMRISDQAVVRVGAGNTIAQYFFVLMFSYRIRCAHAWFDSENIILYKSFCTTL